MVMGIAPNSQGWEKFKNHRRILDAGAGWLAQGLILCRAQGHVEQASQFSEYRDNACPLQAHSQSGTAGMQGTHSLTLYALSIKCHSCLPGYIW